MGELLYPFGLTEEQKASLPVPDYLSDRYRMDLSRKEVRSYLSAVKECVRRGAFIVLEGNPTDPLNTRYKNTEFLFMYGLQDRENQRKILLSVVEEEFCHVVLSNDGRSLYVFCLDRTLLKMSGEYEEARIYLKHDYRPGNDPYNLVISFHALELPIIRAFEDRGEE